MSPLILDDLGAERPTDWVRERLYDVPLYVIDNLHDLTVSEIALRAGCYGWARFFQRQVFQVGGRDIVVIPDADFLSPYKNERFFLEVEQTAKFEHILEKYKKYDQIFVTTQPSLRDTHHCARGACGQKLVAAPCHSEEHTCGAVLPCFCDEESLARQAA